MVRAGTCAGRRLPYILSGCGGSIVRSPDLQDFAGRIEALAEKVSALRRFL